MLGCKLSHKMFILLACFYILLAASQDADIDFSTDHLPQESSLWRWIASTVTSAWQPASTAPTTSRRAWAVNYDVMDTTRCVVWAEFQVAPVALAADGEVSVTLFPQIVTNHVLLLPCACLFITGLYDTPPFLMLRGLTFVTIAGQPRRL